MKDQANVYRLMLIVFMAVPKNHSFYSWEKLSGPFFYYAVNKCDNSCSKWICALGERRELLSGYRGAQSLTSYSPIHCGEVIIGPYENKTIYWCLYPSSLPLRYLIVQVEK